MWRISAVIRYRNADHMNVSATLVVTRMPNIGRINARVADSGLATDLMRPVIKVAAT